MLNILSNLRANGKTFRNFLQTAPCVFSVADQHLKCFLLSFTIQVETSDPTLRSKTKHYDLGFVQLSQDDVKFPECQFGHTLAPS